MLGLAFCIIAYRKFYRIQQDAVMTLLPSAGLRYGAAYSLYFTFARHNQIFVALLDEAEYAALPRPWLTYQSLFCAVGVPHFATVNTTVFPRGREATAFFRIRKGDVYNPVVVVCESEVSDYALEIVFKNGNSWLDSRQHPFFTLMPIEIATLGMVFATWLVNQVMHRRARSRLQDFVGVTVIAGLLALVVKLADLIQQSLHGASAALGFISRVVRMVFDVLIVAAVLLAGKGWCAVSELSSSDFVPVVLHSSVLHVFASLSEATDVQSLSLLVFIVRASWTVTLWLSVMYDLSQVSLRIVAHLVVISRAGVNPYSTPIYGRYVNYSWFLHLVVVYFCGNVVLLALNVTGVLGMWLGETLTWLLNIALLSAMCALFHARDVDEAGYVRFEGDQQSLDLEVEPSSLGADEGLRPWTPEISLPPQPRAHRASESDASG